MWEELTGMSIFFSLLEFEYSISINYFQNPVPNTTSSVEQIGNRANRMDICTDELLLLSSTDIEDILGNLGYQLQNFHSLNQLIANNSQIYTQHAYMRPLRAISPHYWGNDLPIPFIRTYKLLLVVHTSGRAGRPPFDDTGTVIIMTSRETNVVASVGGEELLLVTMRSRKDGDFNCVPRVLIDVAFVTGTDSDDARVEERVDSLTVKCGMNRAIKLKSREDDSASHSQISTWLKQHELEPSRFGAVMSLPQVFAFRLVKIDSFLFW
ncbi:hypothetical protein Tco_0231316 [Tanacetum coccineum]